MSAQSNGHGRNGHVKSPRAHAADAPLTPSADGQEPATGRFLPGNKLGRGNPHYRKLAANRTAFLEAVGPEQVKALADKLLAQALGGDVDAARLVLAYAVGRPQPAADPDGADADEWQRRQEGPHTADVFATSGKIVFGDALRMLQALKPTITPLSLEEANTDA